MCLIYAFNYIMQENNLIGLGMDCHGDYKSPRNDGGYADFVDCHGNGSRLTMTWGNKVLEKECFEDREEKFGEDDLRKSRFEEWMKF